MSIQLKFTVGDKVLVSNNARNPIGIKLRGQVGTIVKINRSMGYAELDIEGLNPGGIWFNDLELVLSSATVPATGWSANVPVPVQAPFNVGDILMCVNVSHSYNYCPIPGEQYTVLSNHAGLPYPLRLRDMRGYADAYDPADFVLHTRATVAPIPAATTHFMQPERQARIQATLQAPPPAPAPCPYETYMSKYCLDEY